MQRVPESAGGVIQTDVEWNHIITKFTLSLNRRYFLEHFFSWVEFKKQ